MVTDAENAAIYLDPVTRQVPRMLSLEDRESFSLTYGCFDRTYWCWKFTDFPGARFQEGVYALAHLFSHSFSGNRWASDERLLEWARAGMAFWFSIQYRDGSFDEAYPFEHSLAATAFTSFYLGEAALLLGDRLPSNDRARSRATFARAGEWLCRNDERHGVLSNHLAAAAAGLHAIYRMTGEERFETRSRYFLQRIYDHQSDEGWYEEYGGADPGYQTHATFYLARIWQLNHDPVLLESLRRSVVFLSHFIHPNGTLGGEYASRNTEFYYPAGLEIMAPHLAEADAIARFMRPSVARQTVAGVSTMDAYNFWPLLNNYLFASIQAPPPNAAAEPLPCQREMEIYFAGAGLWVKSAPSYYAVCGLSKGGVLKVYDRASTKLVASDCGYFAQTHGKKTVSSQGFSRQGDWEARDGEIIVRTGFTQINQRVQTPWLFLGFRVFSLTLGRFQSAAYWLKNILVRVLIYRRSPSPLRLTRNVRFEKDRISVSDRIETSKTLPLLRLASEPKSSTIHMGSSRYFQPQELDPTPQPVEDWADEVVANRCVTRTYIAYPPESIRGKAEAIQKKTEIG